MGEHKKLLFTHGFIKKSGAEYAHLSTEERKKKLKALSEDQRSNLYEYADVEVIETSDSYFSETTYPESLGHLRLVWEAAHTGVEESYFWVLEHMKQDRGFTHVIKITDLYAASEASAFWGNQQQRISAQQNNAQGLLANIGKFVKELFQMVRELRIIDERLDMYESWNKKQQDGTYKRSKAADITLKSLFTDQVEGGTKNPQSVFGLASTVGFAILPDLFFNTHVYDTDEMEKTVEDMDINTSVKNMLKRKLYQFLVWREKTHKELLNRRKFNVSYLRQHWGIIQTYMSWAKPYLKNLKRIQMRQDIDEDPSIVSSFDQSIQEVEILAKHAPKGNVWPVVIVNFTFRTRPDMNIRKEYQQGPTHMGRIEMNFRSYAWTDKQIQNYKAMRAAEDLELLGLLDQSLVDVMEGLGDDFKHYLDEIDPADEKTPKKENTKRAYKQDLQDTLDPFIAVLGGFGELFSIFVPRKGPKKKSGPKTGDVKGAQGVAKTQMFLLWHIFKKSKRMIAW